MKPNLVTRRTLACVTNTFHYVNVNFLEKICSTAHLTYPTSVLSVISPFTEVHKAYLHTTSELLVAKWFKHLTVDLHVVVSHGHLNRSINVYLHCN